MKKLPDGWRNLQLGDICEFTQGIQIPFSEQIQKYQEGYIRYLYIRDFFSDKDKCYVKDIYPHKIMKKEDIMVVNTGNTAGSVYSGAEGVLSNNAFKLTFNKNTLNRDYLYQFLKSYIFDNYIKRLFNSAGQPHVGHKNVALVPIQLPPLQEQKKIAEILSTVDQKIAFIDNQIEETELLKKGLMQKLLTEGIGHTEFKDSEVGRIPKSWNITLMKDIVQINPDSLTNSTDPNLEIEYIDIASIEQTGKISTTNIFKFSNSPSRARRIVNKNDILLSTVRPYLKSFAIVKEEKDNLVCSTGYAVLRAKQNTYYEYIYQFILTDNFMNQVEKMLVGSNYPAINSNDVKNIKVPFPPLEEQKQIAEILSTTDEKLDTLKAKKESFEELKKGLMQKLLTGEVRV